MTKFNILLSKTAEKELNSLEKTVQERIRSALRELESDPSQARPKADIKKLHKMSKHEFYRLRVGNYRIVYFVENPSAKIIKIFTRSKGYEWLE